MKTFLLQLASTAATAKGRVEKAGTAADTLALDVSPSCRGREFQRADQSADVAWRPFIIFSISLVLITNEYSFLNLGCWIPIYLLGRRFKLKLCLFQITVKRFHSFLSVHLKEKLSITSKISRPWVDRDFHRCLIGQGLCLRGIRSPYILIHFIILGPKSGMCKAVPELSFYFSK